MLEGHVHEVDDPAGVVLALGHRLAAVVELVPGKPLGEGVDERQGLDAELAGAARDLVGGVAPEVLRLAVVVGVAVGLAGGVAGDAARPGINSLVLSG